MSFEIRDLMVKLSPAEDPEDDYGQQLPCDDCQTTSRSPGCLQPTLCPCLTLPGSEAPGEEDDEFGDPAPEESEGPSEKAAGPRPGAGLALLQRQLQQALSQTT